MYRTFASIRLEDNRAPLGQLMDRVDTRDTYIPTGGKRGAAIIEGVG